ncbi:protein translocase subunit SecD, partial [Francisellaceae bacterium]|nr:protein translocase subunit SecD [Francisellaceae bacterium]
MHNARNKVPVNRFPVWKYILILFIVVVAFVYALPNIFGETPSLQLSPKNGAEISQTTLTQIKTDLKEAGIPFSAVKQKRYTAQFAFSDVNDQIKAQSLLNEKLGSKMTIALMLAANTPEWLRAIGATPMSLGLDLRGGMYFVLEADLDTAVKSNMENYAQELRTKLREQNIRYSGIIAKGNKVIVSFRANNETLQNQATTYIKKNFPSLALTHKANDITLSLSEPALQTIKNNAVSQVIQVMRNRVNELGVAEASVARAGSNRVVIELPGVQDAARAKQVLGGTATVRFQMVNEKADVQSALAGNVPIGSGLYYTS